MWKLNTFYIRQLGLQANQLIGKVYKTYIQDLNFLMSCKCIHSPAFGTKSMDVSIGLMQ